MNTRLPGKIVDLTIIFCVFGLTTLMIAQRYDAAVTTAVVTATSLAAAELVRRYREPNRERRDNGRDETT